MSERNRFGIRMDVICRNRLELSAGFRRLQRDWLERCLDPEEPHVTVKRGRKFPRKGADHGQNNPRA
jgi:hypothetical protein